LIGATIEQKDQGRRQDEEMDSFHETIIYSAPAGGEQIIAFLSQSGTKC
jgi:hypothetical protein